MIPQASLMMPNAAAEAPATGKGSAAAGTGLLAGDKGNVRADVKGAELSKGLSFADLLQDSDSAEFTSDAPTPKTVDGSDDAAASDKSGGEELPVDLLARLQASLQTNAELTAPKQIGVTSEPTLSETMPASQDADSSSEPAPIDSAHSDAKASAGKQSAMAQAALSQAANTLLSPQANTAHPTAEHAAVTTNAQPQTPDTSASAGGIALDSLLAAGMTKVNGQTLATSAEKMPVADGDNAALGKALLEKAVADGNVITDKSAASSKPSQPPSATEAYRQSVVQDKVTLTSNTALAEGAAASSESAAPVTSPAPVTAELNKKSASPAEPQKQSQEPEPVVTKSPASTAQSGVAASQGAQSTAQQPTSLAQAQDQLLAQAATMQPIQASRVTEQVMTQVQQAPASAEVAAASVSVTKEVLGTSKSESVRESVAPASTPVASTDNQSSTANQSAQAQSASPQLQAQAQPTATSETQARRDSGLTHLGSQRLDGENVPSELQQKVNVMLSDRLQQAELQLEPLGLGRMKIHVQVGQDQQVSVHFVVQHGQTREMVEQSMPRLREMLAGQGISLGQTQVQQQASQQQGQQQGQAQTMADNNGQGRSQGQGNSRGGSSSGQESELTLPTSRLARESANGAGIDFYA